MKKPAKLTVKAELFVAYYVQTRNATESAKLAGYNPRSASVKGSNLLKQENVREAVNQRLGRILKSCDLTAERVITELGRILLADPADAYDDDGALLPLKEWPEDLRRALSGVEVTELFERDDEGILRKMGELKKVRYWSKTDAADKLMRHLGAYAPDRTDLRVGFSDLVMQTQAEPVALPAPAQPGQVVSPVTAAALLEATKKDD